MYLKKSKRSSGRIYLSIADSFRDKEKGYSRTVTVKSLGYLDELEKQHDDPIAHFEQEVLKLNENKAIEKLPITFSISSKERIDADSTNRKNFGYAALSKIYHELEIDSFLINRQRNLKADYNTNSIMKLLVFSRLLYPGSKKKAFESKELFFEKADFSLDDLYRCLSFFNKHKDALQLWLHERIQQQYNRDTKLVYYDVTNYYFEIDEQDELRRKGVSKEHRPDPIVQMGLFMDTMGIPITYKLFPGNTVDKSTLIPMLSNIQRQYSLGRIIVVADKGITTGDNIWYTLSAKNGYVLSYSIRGAEQQFKKYVLAEKGYTWKNDEFKVKSRLYPREINVTTTSGRKMKKKIDEKQVIFYSEKYARKAKADRAAALQKAKDLVSNPAKYNKSTSYGAAKYIKNLAFDSKTGEILEDKKQALIFDEEKLKQEEELDGYYAIVTSEWKETDEKIIEIYRGLWKIEESFKVTKSDFKTRPIYLSTKEHIEAHFLTCFVALVISRILEHRLDGKHYVGKMLEILSKASCTHIRENTYIFDYFDEVLSDIGNELGIDFGKKYMRLGEIKKVLGEVKKR
jgi:transposase